MAFQSSTTVSGLTIVATPGTGGAFYTVTDSTGKEVMRASSDAGLVGGLGTLAGRAEAEGNTELADSLRSAQSQMGSGGAQSLATELRQQIETAKPQTVTEEKPSTQEPPVATTESQAIENETPEPVTNEYGEQIENQDPPLSTLNTDANQPPSISGSKNQAQSSAANQNLINQSKLKDWRVRLSLAPEAMYLYNTGDGILAPLKETNGVVFPYTPIVQLSYNANYDAFDPTHSNYRIYQYKSSNVGEITITGEFTAQDTKEGAYLLAVIHFFRSVTKMFYGQDGQNGEGPRNGTPPPLCFLTGFGSYQFDNHPLVVSSFGLTYPNEVDYIRVGTPNQTGGQNQSPFKYSVDKWIPGLSRLSSAGLKPGAQTADPVFQTSMTDDPTYVPTKMQISITCLPIVSRKDISDNFSLKEYGTGKLLQGRRNGRGGIW